MLILPECGGARGTEGFLWRAPLARRAAVLQVLRMLQVPDRPALHGGEELPLLLCGVQEENHDLEGQNISSATTCETRMDSAQSRENKHWCNWMRAEMMDCGCVKTRYQCLIPLI